MLVEPTLSYYSDLLFWGATVVYLLALVLHATGYATDRVIGSEGAVMGSAAVGAPSAVASAAVAAAPGTVRGPTRDTAAETAQVAGDTRPGRPRSQRLAGMAVSLTVLGAVLHAASIITRGLGTARWPLGNMYEFISAICLFAVAGWLLALRRAPQLRSVGVFVLLPVLVLLFLAGTVLYAQAAPVVPSLQSYWLSIHVTAASFASGLLLVAGVASLLYLARTSSRAPALTARLPHIDVLDRLAYRATIIAMPIWTFAVIAGALWAEAAWGRFWGWDPKETVAFIAWVVYAAYLHARATAGWRSHGAAWINAAGLAVMVFNLFFINLVIAGLHSYAGVAR